MLPLPRWTDSEIQTFHNSSGAALLPGMGPTMTDLTGLKPETGPRLEELFKEAPDLPSRLKPEEMRLFLPTALLGQATTRHVEHDSSPTPIAALQDVTPEFMALCEQAPPGEFLIDPELLLPEMQAQAMRQFLEFHAKDARIHLSVLVLPKNRKLWGEPTLEHIASGSLMGGDSCLVAYPLSEPWRAQMFLSERVHRKASDAFLRETLQACVNSAVQTSDTHDQMHRYMVELSTRLFWLQKALAPASNGINANQLLAQVSTEERNIATSSDSSAFLWKTLCIASTLIILVIHRLRVKRRLGNHAKYVWHFPEPETIPRLGGAFTGGGGGMIRY
ncbi:MAG: hypothetical protein R3F13_00970 [Prosthecobacter sp.]